MLEKVERNRRLYEYHLQHPKMSYAKIGRVFKHKGKVNGKLTPSDASAVYRIICRERNRKPSVSDSGREGEKIG